MKPFPKYAIISIAILAGAIGMAFLIRFIFGLIGALFVLLIYNTGPTTIVKSYEPETQIWSYEINHPQYQTRTIDCVFINALMIGTNQTTLTEDPPYRFLVVAHQTSESGCEIELINAEMTIGESDSIDILSWFDIQTLSFTDSTKPWDDVLPPDSIAPQSATTQFVINHDPASGETITISVTIQSGTNQRTFLFKFLPVVESKRATPTV